MRGMLYQTLPVVYDWLDDILCEQNVLNMIYEPVHVISNNVVFWHV